jgi:hypothetical protein
MRSEGLSHLNLALHESFRVWPGLNAEFSAFVVDIVNCFCR